jgi:hypothetical protein
MEESMNLQRRDFLLAVTLATAVATPALAQTVTSGVAPASGATSAGQRRNERRIDPGPYRFMVSSSLSLV